MNALEAWQQWRTNNMPIINRVARLADDICKAHEGMKKATTVAEFKGYYDKLDIALREIGRVDVRKQDGS